jgi:hypothetical protein
MLSVRKLAVRVVWTVLICVGGGRYDWGERGEREEGEE